MKNLLNTQLVICALIWGTLFAAEKNTEDNLGETPLKTTLFQIDFDNTGNPNEPVTNAKLTAFSSAIENSFNKFVLTNQKLAWSQIVSSIELLESQIQSLELQTGGSLMSLKEQLDSKLKVLECKIKAVNDLASHMVEHLNQASKIKTVMVQ